MRKASATVVWIVVIVRVFVLFSLAWLGEEGRRDVGRGGNCSSSFEKSIITGMSVRRFQGFGVLVDRLLLTVAVSEDRLLDAVIEMISRASWYLDFLVVLALVDVSVGVGNFTVTWNGKFCSWISS